ncbi:Xylulose kinase [Roseibaca ekhonensis]|jgi:xylulokinase|uniref:Xylulose kinase n=1 Tax=Roseinatronobacter ekhonensis TaxID=254356 RepID=A0A3B0MP45_9RHOB|nr:xylulokinase [Roseibaca ekhonensis]SUZ32777.1 Xylulose kinase [Roseibaca ekhonensis]
MSYLGLDLGTSGLKALLVDADGAVIGQATRSYPVDHWRSGWSEQDPAHWVAALHGCVADLHARHPAFGGVRGIGVSGHMHGATLLDAQGAVLRPCILWNDTRAHAEAAEMDADPPFRGISGNIVFPGFTAPKLVWLRRHEPEVFARVAKVLLPAAYMNHVLTGDTVGDMSDAAGTSWLDMGARDWSDTLLRLSGMQPDQMPRLVEGCAAAGQLRDDLARDWGLTGPVIVAGGAGDNAAAACGLGLTVEGQGAVSLGTSGVVMVVRDGYRPAPETAVHTFCHALPKRWYQMGVMLAATDNLNWFARLTGQTPEGLVGELGDQVQHPGEAVFRPYLAGERTPHNSPHLRAGFDRLGANTSRVDLTRAVLEGVCFGLRDNLDALRATGAAPQYLFATGGGSRSDYWLHLLATVLNLPLRAPDEGVHGAALGATRLGMIAATGCAPESVVTPPRACRSYDPIPGLVAPYEDAHASFRADVSRHLANLG